MVASRCSAYYGAPPGWIGRTVKVQWDALNVRLLDPQSGQLLREHLHQRHGGHGIQERDRSKRTPLSTQQLLWRTERAGAYIGQFCHILYERDGQIALRRIQGVLALAKKYGVASTEQACAMALEMGVPQYRFLRNYMKRGPQLSLTLRQIDPLIRELTQYRDLIEQRTKEMPE
jgi:hypothetical protein